jgi:hypothetical protein
VSWSEYHVLSEKFATEAESARRLGDVDVAEDLYRQAAKQESLALDTLGEEKQRTRGITAVSAVALWYKAREFSEAERAAHRYLAMGTVPSFAEFQLRDLLSSIWTARAAEKAGVRFVPGDVLVSVKGGEVIHGGAPLELIVQKVEGIQAVLYRTVEMLLARPFRRRGGPPSDILLMFRPWLFQAPAGSYQFAVRMEEPAQKPLWGEHRPKVNNVTSTFFRVLRAASNSADIELPEVVPDRQYRSAFVNLARNLSPSGKTFDRLEVRDASSPSEPFVTLALDARRGLNVALRNLRPPALPGDTQEPIKIMGTLRGLELDKDWLEIAATDPAPGIPAKVHVEEISEVLDDVVGPMVNKPVLVTVVRRGNKFLFRDIEPQE